jgi:iron complex transport system ATP-binding protein
MSSGSLLLQTNDLQTGYLAAGKKLPVSDNMPALEIRSGQLICLLGPNGSGKSTLLRTLGGLQRPLAGSVAITGRTDLPAAQLAQKISLVLTDRITGNNLDVYSLVALGRYPWSDWLGGLGELDRAAIERAIEATGIGPLRDRKLHTLSDGENQKVRLARALAQDTPLLMLDEPTAHLDLPSRIRLMRLLHRLAGELAKGILLSTHELDLALQVSNEVWLLEATGSLHKGTPEDLILNGIFEAVFAKEDVSFDRATGVFRIPSAGDKQIGLGSEGVADEGLADEGVALFWTRRALQREGFTVTDDAGGVMISREDGRTIWILNGRRFETIRDLLAALNGNT